MAARVKALSLRPGCTDTKRMFLRARPLARKLLVALACAGSAANGAQDNFITCLRVEFDKLIHQNKRRGPRIFIEAEAETRAPEDIPTVTFLNYNMQQFKNLRKVYRKNAKQDRAALVPLDYLTKGLQEQIELIARDRPDIAFLQELEAGADTLADLSMIHLNDDYRVVVMPQVNGTSMGWLLRRDLPFDFEVQSHINVPDPHVLSQKLFVRDLPVLTARLKGASHDDDPLFSLIGVHYKSMGGSVGDATGSLRRGREIEYTAEVVRDLEHSYGSDYPVIILGDFNTNIPKANELAPLRSMGFQDAFARQAEEARLTGEPVPPPAVTHTYFKKAKSKPQYSQLDGQFLSGGLRELDAFIRAYVHPYRDGWGRALGNPKTLKQRNRNPSDHFAVSAEYNFQKIFERFSRKRKAAQEDISPLDRPSKKQP